MALNDGSESQNEQGKSSLWQRLNQPIGRSAKKDGVSGKQDLAGGTPDKTERMRPVAPRPDAGSDSAGTTDNPSPNWTSRGPAAPGGADAAREGAQSDEGTGLNRTIHLGRKTRAEVVIPTKRTMNLFQPTGGQGVTKKTVAGGIALVVGVALFIYFGIAGPYAQVAEKQQELDQANAQLEPIRESIADYDDVLAQYENYTPVSSASGVDATAVMRLVEDHVKTRATVTEMDLEDTTLTITVTNASLDTVGQIAADVAKQQALGVQSASVSNVATLTGDVNDTSNVVAKITVQMVGNAASDDSSDSDSSGSGSSSDSSSDTSATSGSAQ